MSYERMKTRETELRAEVDRWLEAAQAADAQEDKLHGASRRGDEMPGWIADKQERVAKIREAREALEAEAAAAAAAKAEAERAAEEKRKAENRKRSGPVPRPPSKEPDPKAQRNFTDPDSRVLLTKDGFIQGYNAQAAVDGGKQIIVAHGLTQSMSDCPHLFPWSMPSGPTSDANPRRFRRTRAIAVRTIFWRSRPGRSTLMSPPGEPSTRPRPRARSAAR